MSEFKNTIGPFFDFEEPVIELEKKILDIKNFSSSEDLEFEENINKMTKDLDKLKKKIYTSLSDWQKVQIAKHPRRPKTLDYINSLTTNFVELHGDRAFSDDPAIVAGMAEFDGQAVCVMGHQKGNNTKESIHRNFGMPLPEGYRKALRVMKMAEKFGKPIICFLDTPGAFPGIGAEERGQAEAIAVNLREMAFLKVPIIIAVIGEGASGGALGIGVGNVMLMAENSWYSVISPEGCAGILWGDRSKSEEMAPMMYLTAEKLKEINIVDEIVAEPLGGAHREPEILINNMGLAIKKELDELKKKSVDELVEERIERYNNMGFVKE